METGYTELSIVIPFFNEEESVENVCKELLHVITDQGWPSWEVILIDDGSTDRTPWIIDEMADRHEGFRALHLAPNRGQSAALEAGFNAAVGRCIATLDGDGQNDPRDILRLYGILNSDGVDMACGIRKRRNDSFIRRISSRIANTVRSAILGDHVTDVGCSLRVFRRDCLNRIRFFKNAHRFFPALFIINGFRVSETSVNHRAREFGTSKYGLGINTRLWTGIIDLAGVYWLKKRSLIYKVTER